MIRKVISYLAALATLVSLSTAFAQISDGIVIAHSIDDGTGFPANNASVTILDELGHIISEFRDENERRVLVNHEDGVAVGDVNGDGRDEIVIAHSIDSRTSLPASNASVTIFNEFGGVISTFRDESDRRVLFNHGDGLAVGDVNGDGRDEIVIAHSIDTRTSLPAGNASVAIFDAAGGVIGTFQDENLRRVLFNPGDGLAVGDVNGEGGDEIIIAHSIDSRTGFPASNASVTTFDVAGGVISTFRDESDRRVLFNHGDGLAVGDVNGDGRDEIAIAHSIDTRTSLPAGNASIAIFDAFGGDISTFRDENDRRVLFNPGDGFAVGDMRHGGEHEIVIAHSIDSRTSLPANNASVTIFDAAGGIIGTFQDENHRRVLFNHGDFLAVGVSGDRDGDGLLDSWESLGIDFDGGGVDYDLAALGADPAHKDLFIEIDYFDCNVTGGDCSGGDTHDHIPLANAINTVVNSFAIAPVPNPDGTNGINLVAQIDEALPHRMDCELDTTCFDIVKADHFGTSAERTGANSANILESKRRIFRYNLWVHDRPGTTSSGRAEIHGNDFIVSLGSWTSQVGTQDEQAGTFMHEFGHTLGLAHGGDNINCKPNHLSVMSYVYQTVGLQPGNVFDYSRTTLPALNERELNETLGVQDNAFLIIYGPPADLDGIDQGPGGVPDGDPTDDWIIGAGSGAIDWDNDGSPQEISVGADINNLEITGCEESPGQTLGGFNDWTNIKYEFRTARHFVDGVHETDPVEELDYETAQRIQEKLRAAVDRHAVEREYEYAGKIICGVQDDGKDMRLARGFYATTIDIHNPNTHDVSIFKKLALTFPPGGQKPGKVVQIAKDRLGPDEALSVDCKDLENRVFPKGFPASYIEGFVVIQSPKSLDVYAVYTTASLDGKGNVTTHSSIEVEPIEARKRQGMIEHAPPPKRPDLIPVPSAELGGYCRFREGNLLVMVRNQGDGEAGPTTTTVVLGEPGAATRPTPALGPGESYEVHFEIPNEKPIPSIKVFVDSKLEVAETDELNNTGYSECLW